MDERKIAVRVDMLPVPKALVDVDGIDVGKFVVVNVAKSERTVSYELIPFCVETLSHTSAR